jgi:hypothetical protein
MDNNEHTSVPIASDPIKKSRGGISSYDETKTNTVQQVRGEFLSDTFKPRITIAFDSVTFNMSCVNLFPEDQYVVIGVDEQNLRLYVEPCDLYNRDHLKFANFKKGRNNPRKCMTRHFCGMLFLMMGWNRSAKYRCLAMGGRTKRFETAWRDCRAEYDGLVGLEWLCRYQNSCQPGRHGLHK